VQAREVAARVYTYIRADPEGLTPDEVGGDEGTRTPDPRDANAVLSQLSYIPTAGGEYSKGDRGFPN
jgi:hypothetical protein